MSQIEPISPTAIEPPTALPRTCWHRLLHILLVTSLAAGFFFTAFNFYVQHIDFPFGYHPDEATKVFQIIENDRNFNHPLLLLESTELAKQYFHTFPAPLPVLLLGRRVSVFYGALTVLCAALTGYSIGGIGGMLIVGLAVGLCPPLLVYSHYMKEDAGLIAGVSMFVLASRLFFSAKSWKTQLPAALFLGLACAVATSGKYVGVAVCPVGLIVVLIARKWSFVWLPIFLVALVGMVLLINHRAMEDQEGFREGFNKEAEHATTEHFGVTMPRPNHYFVRQVWRETQIHVLLLAAAMGALALWHWRRSRWEFTAILTAGLFLAAVSWSVIPFGRYALPVVMLMYCFTGVGLVRIIQQITWKRLPSPVLYALGVALILGLQLHRTMQASDQFANDSRDQVQQWLAKNMTWGTRIVRDGYSQNTQIGGGSGQMAASNSGSPAALAHQGVKYVVVCELNYDRYVDPLTEAAPGSERGFEHHRTWYRDLFAHYPIVWESVPTPHTYSFTSPLIRVYQVK